MTTSNVAIRRVLLKRGTTAENMAYTGVVGELTLDTDLDTVRVHNGIDAGGELIATQAYVTDITSNISGIGGNINATSVTVDTGVYSDGYFFANGAPYVNFLVGNLRVAGQRIIGLNPVVPILFGQVSNPYQLSHFDSGILANATVASTTHDTGALVVSNGGLGVAGNVFIGAHAGSRFQVGEGGQLLPNVIGQFTSNTESYTQVNMQNLSNSQFASSDFVATADNGNDTENFIDMGIASSTYNYPGYTSISPNDGYLITNGGNLIINAGSVGKHVHFVAGGSNTENVVGTWDSNTLTVNTNIAAQVDNTFDLGSPTNRFRHLYVGPGTVYLGNIKLSDVDGTLTARSVTDPGTDAETDIGDALSGRGGSSLTDEGNVVIAAGSTEHWVATQRKNNFDAQGCALRYDSEGNLYSLVSTFDNNEDTHAFAVVTKYSPAGAVVWQHSIDDLDPLSLAIDSSDCAYVAGEVNNGINLFKFDTDGTELWNKFYSAGSEWLGEAFIEELNSSSIVLVGSTQTIGGGTYSCVVFKINASTGAVLTQKTITNDGENASVSGIDCVDGGETIFVTGRYYDAADNRDKMFIEKLNANLARVWSKSLESPSTYNMSGGDCASDAYGNIYAVGSYNVIIQPNNDSDSPTGTAAILTKLNSSGVVQWTRRIGPGPCGTAAVGVNVSSDNYLYLTSMTTVRKTDDGTINDYEMEGEGQNKMLLAKYDLNGAVVWQRYVDARNINEFNNEWPGLCVATFNDKIAVQFYGNTWDTTVFNYSSTDDYEYDFFVVQLPADGTELTIGNLDFTASRVPGRFVTHETTDSPTVLATFDTSVLVENSELALDSAARVANSIVKSEVYEYTFGADGTLTIPNDGDVKLTQTQLGYLMAIGGATNNNNNIYGRAVTADADSYMYVVGQEDDSNQPFVAKIDPQGGKVWNVRIQDNEDGNSGRANGVTLDSATGNVVVVCEMYGNYTYSIVVRLDQDTGQILELDKFSDTDTDVYLNDVVVTSANTYVVAGSKMGEFSPEQSITPVTGSTTSILIVLRSEVNGTPTTNWQIGGTGISPFENIANIEYYAGITGTVRQGSSATFDIIDNGNGTYSASIVSGGTNYLAGHKIKILGSAIGGVDSTNDIIITVDAVDAGVITSVSNNGTAAGVTTATYSGLTGANYNIGSGFVLNFGADPFSSTYDSYYNFSVSNGGSNYAEGDVITISGTQLGGTSPANDLTITAYTGGTGSVIAQNAISGTAQTSTWKLATTTAVDFAGTGTWTVTYPLDRENFLATPSWQRTFGTNTGDYTDRLYALAVDTSGNIITVGQGYGETSEGSNDNLATVFKFNSSGTLQWTRQLNETNDNCQAMSVATIGTDIYVTHDSNDNGNTVISKLSADGTVVWQRITDSSDDSVVANAGDGNILVAIEAYNSDIDTNALKIIKMTPSGETVYKRWLFATTDSSTNFKNGRCLTVAGDSYYVAAYFYANNYDSTFAAKLAINGDGVGEYGSFRYSDVNAQNGNYNWPGLNGINYDINEVNLISGYAGAVSVTPYVNTVTTVTVVEAAGDFYVDLFDVDHTVELVRDIDGGRIVFADGTTQSTSAQDVPQRTYTGQKYTLGMMDRGHHIYCREQNDNIIVPYDARVPFPIGTVITIVNDSGSSVYIGTEGSSTSMFIAGDGDYTSIELFNYGIATLLKVGRERWVISGNVQSD